MNKKDIEKICRGHGFSKYGKIMPENVKKLFEEIKNNKIAISSDTYERGIACIQSLLVINEYENEVILKSNKSITRWLGIKKFEDELEFNSLDYNFLDHSYILDFGGGKSCLVSEPYNLNNFDVIAINNFCSKFNLNWNINQYLIRSVHYPSRTIPIFFMKLKGKKD